MKDLKKIIFWVLFSALICALIFLFIKWVQIVKPEFEQANLIIYITLCVIFFYYLIFYIIRPTFIKWFKIINTLVWLLIIFISQYFVANSGVDSIFYGDILCLIWVALTIIWPTNALASKKELKERDLEIIEA